MCGQHGIFSGIKYHLTGGLKFGLSDPQPGLSSSPGSACQFVCPARTGGGFFLCSPTPVLLPGRGVGKPYHRWHAAAGELAVTWGRDATVTTVVEFCINEFQPHLFFSRVYL